jgi:hypothetical protein
MTTFTIDEQNNITAWGSVEEAATTTTPFASFVSQQQLTDLADQWPAARLVAIWNSLPGVTPVHLDAHPGAGYARAAATRTTGQ